MKSGTRIGLAVGVGYLLGRRRRLRTALTLAAAVGVGRMSRAPGGLAQQGRAAMRAVPDLGRITQLGGPLAAAGKAAAGSSIDAVSGRIRDRAAALRGGGSGKAAGNGNGSPGGEGEGGADKQGGADKEGGTGGEGGGDRGNGNGGRANGRSGSGQGERGPGGDPGERRG
jgi:hypothetical protein